MNLADIIFRAFALSVDAMAVSFSYGILCGENKNKNALLIALFTGSFQFLMPVAGYYFANLVYGILKPFGSFIACAIFLILGLKFLYDAIFAKDRDEISCCLTVGCLLTLAFATSIDALAAGVNIRFLDVNIFYSSLIIGFVTFFDAFLGFYLGNLFKKFPSKILQIFSGIVLLLLALKSVI